MTTFLVAYLSPRPTLGALIYSLSDFIIEQVFLISLMPGFDTLIYRIVRLNMFILQLLTSVDIRINLLTNTTVQSFKQAFIDSFKIKYILVWPQCDSTGACSLPLRCRICAYESGMRKVYDSNFKVVYKLRCWCYSNSKVVYNLSYLNATEIQSRI